MTDERPSACSLEGRELEERLEEIAALGSECLLGHEIEGERHRLRFPADEETQHRLEALVAAEAECCPFLDLVLVDGGEELVLTVSAPATWGPSRRG